MIIRAFVVLAILIISLQPSLAEEDDRSDIQSIGLTTPGTDSLELVDVIRKRLELKTGIGDLEDDERQALFAFYTNDAKTPIWISDGKPTPKAYSVVDELKQAGDYGFNSEELQIPDPTLVTTDITSQATFELNLIRSALTYARYSKGGRVKPGQLGSQLNHEPELLPPLKVMEALEDNEDAAAYLRALHPKNRQFEKLRTLLLKLRHDESVKEKTVVPQGPVLRRGMKHDQVVLLRHRLNPDSVSNGSRPEDKIFDESLEKSVKSFQRTNGLNPDGIVGSGTRRVLNGESRERLIRRILINMERWRWLPDNLERDVGIAVWANIPEFRVRVLKDQEVVFSEKAIVGQVSHKTPVFSDQMEWIEIHPVWFVPDSIKVGDILPSLKRKTSTVMQRYNLRVHCSGLGSNHKNIDWHSVDIRKCSFTQPPGRKSVLGDFKFKFPNKYLVYMHDTHKPGLFSATTRTYSHGCIRVRKPRVMAEILLNHDKGMTSDSLGKILSGPKNPHKEIFTRPVPVHITYFTALFDDEDNFLTTPDYYGHDRRLATALDLN